MKVAPLVLAGGFGKRLMPISNSKCPKQFVIFFHDKYSLFQLTIKRIRKIFAKETILVCCNKLHIKIVEKQLRKIYEHNYFLLIEEEGRNTFGSVIVGLKFVDKLNFDTLFVVPSDSYIERENEFIKNINNSINYSFKKGRHILFGINPAYASDKYGYLRVCNKENNNISNEFVSVDDFKEKPNIDTAKQFLQDGRYYWNSGHFIFNIEKLKHEIQEFEQNAYNVLEDLDFQKIDNCKYFVGNDFCRIPDKQIDVAILEKSENLSCCLATFDWLDVGSFEVLEKLYFCGKIELPKKYYSLILFNKDLILISNL